MNLHELLVSQNADDSALCDHERREKMMGKVWRLLLLALLLNASLATMALARPVYLADGGIIQAQKVWKEEGRIYVLVNRDSLIHFAPEELNLKKTFAKKCQAAEASPGKKRVTAKAPAATTAALPGAAVAPSTAKGDSAAKVSTPPAPAVPAPVAQKPAPRPRPVAAPAPPAEGSEILGLVSRGVGLFFLLVLIVSFWKVFAKAGEAGWKSLIPVYNLFVLLRMAGCPGWWLLMFFLPVINIYFLVVMHIRLAEKFGKSALFGFALFFLGFIFFPLLAFGPATYEGEESFTFDEE
jgi:hypothetical protein